MKANSSRWKQAAQKFLAGLAGILFALLLTEIFLRVVYDPSTAQPEANNAPLNLEANQLLFISDPVTGFRMRPDTEVAFTRQSDLSEILVTTNGQGFRDDHDYVVPKPPDTLRILLSGDSLAFGAGVEFEHTPGELLEDRLATIYPEAEQIEVMNWGIGGFGLEQEYLLLESMDAASYEPELILVMVTTSNDFRQARKPNTLQEVAGLPVSDNPASDNIVTPQVDDEQYSSQLSIVERVKKGLRHLRTYYLLATYYNRFMGAIGKRDVTISEADTQANEEDLAAFLTNSDIPVAFILVPPRVLARPLDETYAYERLVYDYYADTLDRLGAAWLDLEVPLIDEAALQNPDEIYWDGVHLTEEGNMILAEAVAGFVKELEIGD